MECSEAVLSLDIKNIKVDLSLREIILDILCGNLSHGGIFLLRPIRPILVWDSGHLHPF